jgi:nucleoside-diphosphate-sugar epimerase
MRIFMTGSAGPKVGHLVAEALARSHVVTGMDLRASPFTHCIADITAVADWRPFLDGVDAVVHFAALHAPHRDTHSSHEFRDTNVAATARLLAAAKASGVGRFLLASTTSVYGKSMRTAGRAAWVTEALSPEPEDIYDETKLAAEAICREAYSPGFVTAALRFSRSFPEPPPLMALYRLYRGVDGRDVAGAFSAALAAPLDGFQAMNISGDTPFIESDCEALYCDPVSVLQARVPGLVTAFKARGWDLPACIDRVYVSGLAKQRIGYAPQFGWCAITDAHPPDRR